MSIAARVSSTSAGDGVWQSAGPMPWWTLEWRPTAALLGSLLVILLVLPLIHHDLQRLNAIIDEYGLGTAFGNMMQKRYLVSTKFVKNSASEAERKKFLAMVDLFKKYSDQYDVDYLLMAAQGLQESGLEQSVRSQVGAVGGIGAGGACVAVIGPVPG